MIVDIFEKVALMNLTVDLEIHIQSGPNRKKRRMVTQKDKIQFGTMWNKTPLVGAAGAAKNIRMRYKQ